MRLHRGTATPRGGRPGPRRPVPPAPGRPVEDLAYAAWHFVPLHGELMGDGSTGPDESDRPRRLRVLCDAYGLDAAARAGFLGEVAGMEVGQAASVGVDAQRGDPAARELWADGRFTEATARSLGWLGDRRGALEAALEGSRSETQATGHPPRGDSVVVRRTRSRRGTGW